MAWPSAGAASRTRLRRHESLVSASSSRIRLTLVEPDGRFMEARYARIYLTRPQVN